jgi:hypothetical protein
MTDQNIRPVVAALAEKAKHGGRAAPHTLKALGVAFGRARTEGPSASSAIDTEVRIFRSSSTTAIVCTGPTFHGLWSDDPDRQTWLKCDDNDK